ncbi:uncharacterized protein BDZ99DRAFT_106216 [Mytilinidion resinicola]|uniref:RING-type domain-containing protein n=1 Tax=Mytilinidion resinicola TaxID=574789 RepID=A0A6A6Y9J4_9PEZI|nr:uncharacterized protein BDZ99DRAFT_106216 [Mytilinidion resinicola]KAF2805492.1 hypothetical protein BDZ99DRAFT_106216 [Mytilinidion resinicola]
MTTVFGTAVPWPAKDPNKQIIVSTPLKYPTSGKRTTSATSSLSDAGPEADPPDLRELNNALQALTDVFPDIQPEVFREMLSSFDKESRLQVITESLLKHGAKWVRGRYRMPQEQEQQQVAEGGKTYKYRAAKKQDSRGEPLPVEERFRSENYKNAVKAALYQEFKGLSHSTIRAVLAEYNYSYTQARPTLFALVSKSWRYSITSFLMRRKPPSAENHPLVSWRAADPKTGRPPVPRLAHTKSTELDKELFETLVVPVLTKQRADQVRLDRELAEELNEAEAEEAGEMYDCECCFTPSTLEQLSTCDEEGHYVCFRCIKHSINAALYDQSWSRNIDSAQCTLRCVAPVADGLDVCTGCIHPVFIRRALGDDQDGNDTFRRLEERSASETLQKSQLPLIRCPFCAYAEVDMLDHPSQRLTFRPSLRAVSASSPLAALQTLYNEALTILLYLFFIFLSLLLQLATLPPLSPLLTPLPASLARARRKRRGLRFTCAAPACARSSCLTCLAEWHDIHICHESSKTALRTSVERAMADAIKRTCPKCNLSFVKSTGCNKLTCVCGYTMCYVCRADIREQSYAHFCQHFREQPGVCKICERCDLYRTEDEEVGGQLMLGFGDAV